MPRNFGGVTAYLLACAAIAACSAAAGADVIIGSAADQSLLHNVPANFIFDDSFTGQVGVNGGIMRTLVVPFQLPARPAGTVVSTADVRFQLLRNMQTSAMNVDLYALTPRASSDVLASDRYAGPLDAGATLIQDNYVTVAGTDINNYVTVHTDAAGDGALASYLNSAYDNYGAGAWVFLRLSCDNASTPNIDFYFVYTSNWAQFVQSRAPQIELTFAAAPAPGAAALLAAGGLAAGRRRRMR
jgi:hypothetical protein